MEDPYSCMECNHYIEIEGDTETYRICELIKKYHNYINNSDCERDDGCPFRKSSPYTEPRFFELKCGNIKEIKKEKVNE